MRLQITCGRVVPIRSALVTVSLVLAVCVLAYCQLSADDRPFGPLAHRSLELSGAMDDGSEYVLKVVLKRRDSSDTDKISNSHPCFGYPLDGDPIAIEELSLEVEDKIQWIPENSYSDLCDVNLTRGIGVGEDEDSIFVYLMGGLGRRSYNVTFAILGDRLVSRRVEFTDSNGAWKSEFVQYTKEQKSEQ